MTITRNLTQPLTRAITRPITQAGAGGGGEPVERLPPAGVTPPYGLQVFALPGARTFTTNINLAPPLTIGDPGVTTVYVDPVAGSDSNPGTSSQPYKSISKGIQENVDSLIVMAKPGLYDQETSWGAESPVAYTTQVVPWGDGIVVCSAHHAGLTWTLTSGATYSATIVDCGSVADASILTADGDYSMLSLLASQALVEATPGSYYVSGTTVYVHTADGRVPDSAVRVYRSFFGSLSNGRAGKPYAQTLYMESVAFDGGNNAFCFRQAYGHNCTLLAKDCAFNYAGGNGLAIVGRVTVVLQGCRAIQSGADGYNYHVYTMETGVPNAVEIDCIARGNGRDSGGTNNGSSIHELGSTIVRVNGDYHHNQNNNIHDVGGVHSWNLGVKARDSQTAGYFNFVAGLGGETDGTMMWLDACTSSGSDYDLWTPNAAYSVIYTSELVSDGNNWPGSNIQSYTP